MYGVHGCSPHVTASEAREKWDCIVKTLIKDYDVLPVISEQVKDRKSWRTPTLVCVLRSAVFSFAGNRVVECAMGIQENGVFRVDLVAIDECMVLNKTSENPIKFQSIKTRITSEINARIEVETQQFSTK